MTRTVSTSDAAAPYSPEAIEASREDIAVLNAAFRSVQADHPGLTVAQFDAAIANVWHEGIALDDLVSGASRHLAQPTEDAMQTPTITAETRVMTRTAGEPPLWQDSGSLAEWLDGDLSGIAVQPSIGGSDTAADRWPVWQHGERIGALCADAAGLTLYVAGDDGEPL